MMVLGSVCGVISGVGFPCFILIIGLFVDELIHYRLALSQTNISSTGYYCIPNEKLREYISVDDPDSMLYDNTTLLTIYVLVLVGMYALSSVPSKVLWSYSALKQMDRLRIKFFRSLLLKDVTWYDLNPSTELHTYLTE